MPRHRRHSKLRRTLYVALGSLIIATARAAPTSPNPRDHEFLPDNSTLIESLSDRGILNYHDSPLGASLAGRITVDPVDTYSGRLKRRSWAISPKVAKGAIPNSDTNIALINATPYRWKKTHTHSYQMGQWHTWPMYIYPGQAVNHRALGFRGVGNTQDTAGEVTYELEGTSEPMAFEVRYRTKSLRGSSVHVEFKDELQTDATEKGTRFKIGSNKMPAGQSFILAGHEGSFTSTTEWNSDSPGEVAWMQSLLPYIGEFSLREIIMPRSHHCALYKGNYHVEGAGSSKGNTVTQIHDVGTQLRREGVRVIDTRVFKDGDQYYEAHGTAIGRQWFGARGKNLASVVEDINKFTSDHPGELIIWDFHSETWNHRNHSEPLNANARSNLYNVLRGVQHRPVLPEGLNVADIRLKDLIGHGTSAVIIRFNQSWKEATPDTFPSPMEGFVDTHDFPVLGLWSNKYRARKMRDDQIAKLEEYRRSPMDGMYDMQWVRTLTGASTFIIPSNFDLVDMGREAMTELRTHAWNSMTSSSYPNWITLDAIDGGEVRSLFTAMNKCFVAQMCGDWTGEKRSLQQVEEQAPEEQVPEEEAPEEEEGST